MTSTTTAPSSFPTQYTKEGTPYISLPTKSSTPIFLTPVFPSDAEAMTETLSISSVNLALMAPPYPYNLADAEWFINHVFEGKAHLPLASIRAGEPGKEGRWVGSCGVTPFDPAGFYHFEGRRPEGGEVVGEGEGNRTVEIGYLLHTEFQGRGIMRPAVRAAVEWSRRECGVKDAVLRVLEGNVKSRAVVEGMEEFVFVNEDEKWQDWPETKGGGRKRIYSWIWKG